MIFPNRELNDLNFNEFSQPFEGIFSVYGNFGVGRTTFALQTALNTAKLGNNVVYCYTKPSLPQKKIKKIIQNGFIGAKEKILLIQPSDLDNLNTIIFNLELLYLEYIKQKNLGISLIIIDSITDLYRLELNRDKKEKNITLNYLLNQILANLLYLNISHGIEVIIVNDVSMKKENDQFIATQSGGKVMDYWVSYSLKISRLPELNLREFELHDSLNEKKLNFSSLMSEKGFLSHVAP